MKYAVEVSLLII